MLRRLTAGSLGALALVACGCGTDARERDARTAVEAFYAAYAAKDGAGACRQLSDDASSALENWHSEFLAVGSMSILAVYLGQRGSPESKPVGAPQRSTGKGG